MKIARAPKGALKLNFAAFQEIITDRPTDKQTDRPCHREVTLPTSKENCTNHVNIATICNALQTAGSAMASAKIDKKLKVPFTVGAKQ